ncbi:MAG: Nif3-like dinuclear metal center hexameric protein [Coriobacteriia bacterium]|nr:Nif3-like dinuclear metal center hexameric protein [Coriobacteriia bacterium]
MSGKLPDQDVTVADVLDVLDAQFPLAEAEAWDRVGLLSGDPARPVKRIVCALDPCVETLSRARQAGADLLVTHHPTYLQPEPDAIPAYGLVLEAVARGLEIALIACHTNLDASEKARLSLGAGLPLTSCGPLGGARDGQEQAPPAFAQLWAPARPLTVEQIAGLLVRHHQAPVRLTRAPALTAAPTKIATATGAGGDATEAAIEAGADLLITGELKYHQLIEARDRGLSCIELGHDVSEWPLAALLCDTLTVEYADREVSVTLLERDLPSQIITAKDSIHE